MKLYPLHLKFNSGKCIFVVDTKADYMRTKIQKWGNSLALRIPRGYAKHAKLNTNSEVDIKLDDNKIIIKPVVSQKELLDELLSGIDENNVHREIETGAARGNEIW